MAHGGQPAPLLKECVFQAAPQTMLEGSAAKVSEYSYLGAPGAEREVTV